MKSRRCEVCGGKVDKGLMRKSDSNYWVKWKEKKGYSIFGWEFAGKVVKTYYHSDCIDITEKGVEQNE